jgi:hypothetical protein
LVATPVVTELGDAANVARSGATGGPVPTTTCRVPVPALLVQLMVNVVTPVSVTLVACPLVTSPTPWSIVHVGTGLGTPA